MQALRCDYCGGHIDPVTYKCPYRGTQYLKPKEEFVPGFLQKPLTIVHHAPCQLLRSQHVIDRYEYERMRKYNIPVEEAVRHELVQSTAEKLTNVVRLEEKETYCEYGSAIVYRADIRVVDPSYRF